MGEVRPIKPVPATAWKTGNRADYDPSKFYTRATDDNGHSSAVRAAIPPDLMTEIADLVERTPQYKRTRDFVRDAMVHRLHELNAMDPNPRVDQWLQQERLLSTIEYHDRQLKERERIVKDAEETLFQLQRVGDRKTILATIVDLEDYAETLPEFWKVKLDLIVSAYR